MKNSLKSLLALCLSLTFTSCSATNNSVESGTLQEPNGFENTVTIELSDEGITVDKEAISTDVGSAVYLANDIVYYEEGKDFTYGEGTEEDAHSLEEANKHAVVHITQPGIYVVSGKLSFGQIAVDLGDGAKENPNAVVTLILNGVDITCTVAPAVIFYNVYECGSDDEEKASAVVDTASAGANVLIADGTVNTFNGSYVARIYKPDSVELNEAGTEVVDSKKLHKYDAAFYSKQSMNINGDAEGTGILKIKAENEGLDSELHLTINGGNIHIKSGNDGINTNEDNVSVTTVNGGVLEIVVDGSTGEGDGIDSNGWLVINGGTVIASACGFSMDAGIDSDKGIIINGGTVIASGNMLDHISESKQNYAVFSFASSQDGNQKYTLKDSKGDSVLECTPKNSFNILIVSSEQLITGTYTLWMNNTQLSGAASQAMGGFGGGMMPNPGVMEFPEDMKRPGGQMPEGMGFSQGEMPEGMEFPQGEMPKGEFPQNMGRPHGGKNSQGNANFELSKEFMIDEIENVFSNIQPAK